MKLIIFIAVWIIGWLTAYPKNKKFRLSEINYYKNKPKVWTNKKMLESLFICFILWYLVWFWYLFEKYDDFIDNWTWLDKPSKF